MYGSKGTSDFVKSHRLNPGAFLLQELSSCSGQELVLNWTEEGLTLERTWDKHGLKNQNAFYFCVQCV